MKKIILSFIFAVFLVVLTVNDIFACDCIKETDDNLQESVEYAYKNSDAVFSGEVIEKSKKPGSNIVKVKFKIGKSWKNVSQEEVIIITNNSDECGHVFEVGKKYLVYAQGKIQNLETNKCSRTSISESNKDVDFLNQIKKLEIMSSPK